MPDPTNWLLEIHDDAGKTRRVKLKADAYQIGRSTDADIQLERQTVSRQHARLFRNASGGWSIEDMGSRSGTLVNAQKAETIDLSHGDIIEISRFRLHLLDPSRRTTAPAPRQPVSAVWSDATTDPDISVLTHITPPKLDTSHITALHDFGRELLAIQGPDDRLDKLCTILCGPIIRGRWAMALCLDADDINHPPQQLALGPATAASGEDLYLSRSVIRAMQQSNAPVLANNFNNASAAGVVEMSMINAAPATAVVACPLGDDADDHRLVYVNLPPVFGQTEWLALIALAVKQYQQAEASWAAREAIRAQAALERDMQNARAIQQSILPKPCTDVSLDVAWSFHPCDAVGGDLVDVVPMKDGGLLLVIADVTGHGLPAALTALSIHSIIHTCVRNQMPLPAMMTALNDHLYEYLPDGRFVTMVCLAVDLASGQLQCINAGHQPPAIRQTDGSFREFPLAEEPPLGVTPTEFTTTYETLEHGELIVVTTDGLTELQTKDNTMLRNTGVQSLLSEAVADHQLALPELIDSVRRALDRARIDPRSLDDETFLLATRPMPSQPNRASKRK